MSEQPTNPFWLRDMINGLEPAKEPPSIDGLLEAIAALKRERDKEPPKDYIEVVIQGPGAREKALRLAACFSGYRKVQTVTDDEYERQIN